MTQTQRREYNKIYPIFQSRHTGLFGFERANGACNLSACPYQTKRSAVIARNKSCQAMDDNDAYNKTVVKCPKCGGNTTHKHLDHIGTCYNCYIKSNPSVANL